MIARKYPDPTIVTLHKCQRNTMGLEDLGKGRIKSNLRNENMELSAIINYSVSLSIVSMEELMM